MSPETPKDLPSSQQRILLELRRRERDALFAEVRELEAQQDDLLAAEHTRRLQLVGWFIVNRFTEAGRYPELERCVGHALAWAEGRAGGVTSDDLKLFGAVGTDRHRRTDKAEAELTRILDDLKEGA